MNSNSSISIAVFPAYSLLRPAARKLADKLHLPLTADEEGYDIFLVFTPDRLELRQTGPNSPGPVFVDFTSGAIDYRRRYGGGRRQPLAKAVGLKGRDVPSVLDATAGLGRDAFVLATLGCCVHLVERSPIVAALLEDGLRRAGEKPELADILRRMRLTTAESTELIASGRAGRPDVVYLDPMYPHRRKSALVKKEMRLLRFLVGDDPDATTLLKASVDLAAKRVVVKRPRTAPPIAGPRPSMAIKSKNSRFDVYLKK